MKLNRRNFIKSATAGVVGASVAGTAGLLPRRAYSHPGQAGQGDSSAPKSVIFCVSDGMSAGMISLAEQFSQMVRGRGTHLHRLLNNHLASRGFFETYSLTSFVTDSAAAATAWGSGTRVINGAINTLPDGTELTPIGNLVKDSGRGFGLVTTATVTHATPAGFASVSAGRGDESGIAPQYLDVADVVLGGGQRFFLPALRADGRDVAGEYRAAGYHVSLTKEELAQAGNANKLLGLYSNSHVPYTLDHINDAELAATVPTLAEMSQAALRVLARNDRGFLLQIEGARVDHAAHGNDAAAIIWDQLAFDDALGVALEFASRRNDVLVVFASDHGNANPGLFGSGSGYRDSNIGFAKLAESKRSMGLVQNDIRNVIRENSGINVEALAKHIQDITEATQAIQLNTGEASAVANFLLNSEIGDIFNQHRNFAGVYGRALANHHCVGWNSTQHTDEYTIIGALGPGQGNFEGILKNTNFFDIITHFFDIKHVNPAMEANEARKFLASVPVHSDIHWA